MSRVGLGGFCWPVVRDKDAASVVLRPGNPARCLACIEPLFPALTLPSLVYPKPL